MSSFLAGYVHSNKYLTGSAHTSIGTDSPVCLMQTIVSVSTRIIHDNPEIFPNPASFNPDRWLGEKGKELERWNVSFSKGPRQCIGIK